MNKTLPSRLNNSSLNDHSVVCLMAPTASGKTALAYELFDTGRFELISVDSALIYQDMDIGTAKPTKVELERYPHHLVDIIDPTQSYSVAQFVQDVSVLIDQIHQNGKIPLLVGGTMMYFMALIDGISAVPDSDEAVRDRVESWRQVEGIGALYDYLAEVDPITHQRLKPNDTQRITRAVEVYLQTKTPISTWQEQPKSALSQNPDQDWHALGIFPDRAWLHDRIQLRLDIMWQDGLIDEVIRLLERYPLTPNMPSMRAVGYRQVLEYLVAIHHPVFELPHLDKALFYQAFDDQSLDFDLKKNHSNLFQKNQALLSEKDLQNAVACHQMQNKALYATRQLAKRQFTWLRKLAQLQNLDSKPSLSPKTVKIQSFEDMALAKSYLC